LWLLWHKTTTEEEILVTETIVDIETAFFIIRQASTVVHNLVPVRRNSDNVLGMYDTVSDTFFSNQGDGTFTAGNPINNNVYIPQNQ